MSRAKASVPVSSAELAALLASVWLNANSLGKTSCVSQMCLVTGACTIIDYVRDDGSQSPFPLIRCGNIFVLPGVPDLLQAKWKVQRGISSHVQGATYTVCCTSAS